LEGVELKTQRLPEVYGFESIRMRRRLAAAAVIIKREARHWPLASR